MSFKVRKALAVKGQRDYRTKATSIIRFGFGGGNLLNYIPEILIKTIQIG